MLEWDFYIILKNKNAKKILIIVIYIYILIIVVKWNLIISQKKKWTLIIIN